MEIKIVDSIMGSGKTTAAINYINARPDKKYMYVTPFLDEVQRIKESCRDCNFFEPTNKNKKGNKKKGIELLISAGKNIATTHALFKQFTPDIVEMIRTHGYELILDEVTDVIEPLEGYNECDIEDILANYVT